MATTDNSEIKKAVLGALETPKNEATEMVESTRKNLVLQKLLSLVKGFNEVCEKSETTEARVIPEEEIIRVILDSCDLCKLNLEGLEIAKVSRNEQGAVVVLEAKTPEEDGGYSQFGFTKQGVHKRPNSKSSYKAMETNISRDIMDKDGDFVNGGTVFTHKDGTWIPFATPKVEK